MSIGSVLSNALTGLNASQTALRVISQNISNANTPGYVRASVQFSPQVIAGGGAGVSTDAITRAADRFLAQAQRLAGAAGASASAQADLLDRAQAVFGDPNGDQTFFTRIDDVFTSLQSVALDPTSSVTRRNVISSIQDALAEFSRVSQAIEDLRLEADSRVSEAVGRASSLLQRISDLNGQVSLSIRSGSDPTGAQNARGQLIDELSTLLDVRATERTDGTIELRTNSGALLVGLTAARLSYSASATPYGPAGSILINEGEATEANFGPSVGAGLIRGLMESRDIDLPNLSESISTLAAVFSDTLNGAHSTSVGSPPASRLVGRNTGLLASDSLNFTGQSVVAITDASGFLVRRATIDFDAGTIITENPANTQTFTQTVGSFTTALNAALQLAPAQASATFVNGVLTLDTGTTSGIALGNVASDPSARAGKNFNHFFGLNDLIRSDTPIINAVGLQGTDAHGLNGAGVTRFRVTDAAGRIVLERDVAVTGTTWNDYIAGLNNGATGIGQYATSAFNSVGSVTITPASGYIITAISDTTERGATGLGVTELFGLDRASTAGRPHELRVDAAIVASPSRLGLARPDLTAGIGDRIIDAGDSRGAQAMVAARETQRSFGAGGTLPAQTTTLGVYASRLAGEAARLADDAGNAATGAQAVLTAATERRSQAEGVSIDEELVRMTQFQQSYAAASRLIQAAKEMIDMLLSIG